MSCFEATNTDRYCPALLNISAAVLVGLVTLTAPAQAPNSVERVERDIEYATTEQQRLLLDLYVLTILKQSTPHGLSVRVPALELLLGGQPEDNERIARLASPVFHVDREDPPILLIHGDQDPQVPINQSHELHAAYKQHGGEVLFEVVHGGAHGGAGFFDSRRDQIVAEFFVRHLSGES